LDLNHLLSQAPALFFHFSWTDPAACLSKVTVAGKAGVAQFFRDISTPVAKPWNVEKSESDHFLRGDLVVTIPTPPAVTRIPPP
jgi:hypothetical protein